MARQGKYTKKKTRSTQSTWFLKRRWRWFKGLSRPKKALVLGGPLLAFLIVTPIFTYIYYYNDIANQERLMNRNNTGIVLTDKEDKTFYSIGRAEHRDIVPLDKISDVTEQAVIASEDKDFYDHAGFSIFSIFRSIYSNILAGSATSYGGSTLTQQLAKNTLLSSNKTFLRKYQELTVATAIEQRYSKDEILDMYLNSVYFGNNSFGIEDAAKNYFNAKPSELTLAQASILIGVLPAPSSYSPVDGSVKFAKQRQNTVLTRMVENDYITSAQKDTAVKKKLTYNKAQGSINNAAPHFTEMVLQQLYDKYGEEKVKRSGYQVRTSLDLSLQTQANRSVEAALPYIQANGGSNSSVVAVDPKTGKIRALVGSIDYENKEFGMVNMATTKRQPGSSFKPVYYGGALANGTITTETILKDQETDFNGYKPQNADRSFRGDVSVRQALDWSLNIPAVKVMQRYGISNAVETAKDLGITTIGEASDYGLSLALGSAEVPLTEMTNAYAAFANEGDQYPLTSIEKINSKYGKKIFESKETSRSAISPQGAYLLSDILSDNTMRDAVFGGSLTVTGTDFQVKKVAVKTGTTDDARDAWTIGYTPNIAIGVWVGNNDNAAMLSGGSDMAGPVWRTLMGDAIGSSSPSFQRPSGIVEKTICTTIGIKKDVFLASNIPASTCSTTPAPKPEAKPKEKDDTSDTTKKDKKDTSSGGTDTSDPEPIDPATPPADLEPIDPATPPADPATFSEPQ